MTIEITSNPHSFIVFLTLCMGLGYAFFNRPGFGIGKLFVLVIIGGLLFITAYERHHIVDVSLGLFIGFLHAKGKLGVVNPYVQIRGYFERMKWQSQFRKAEKEEAWARAEFEKKRHEYQEQEARKRQEQAQREREQRKHKRENKSSRSNNSQEGSSNHQKSRKSNNNHYQKPKPKPPSERDKALAVLGLESNATKEEAKRAYRKLMSLYHPDKLAGLPEGRRKQAEEEAKKINVAWSLIQKSSD